MSLARLVITAVSVEGRASLRWPVTTASPGSGCSPGQAVRGGGEAAFQPHPRRPRSNPRAVNLDVEDRIVRLRKTLTKNGLDAGASTTLNEARSTTLQASGLPLHLPDLWFGPMQGGRSGKAIWSGIRWRYPSTSTAAHARAMTARSQFWSQLPPFVGVPPTT